MINREYSCITLVSLLSEVLSQISWVWIWLWLISVWILWACIRKDSEVSHRASQFFTFSDVISVTSDVSISSIISTICWCLCFITSLRNSVSSCTEYLRNTLLTLCCRFSDWFTADIISLTFHITFDYFFFCAMRALQHFCREIMSESNTDLTWL